MSQAIYCKSGNGEGKVYQIDPSGHLLLIIGERCDPGWRLATQADIDAKAQAAKGKPEPKLESKPEPKAPAKSDAK